jgi:hypothetical protein
MSLCSRIGNINENCDESIKKLNAKQACEQIKEKAENIYDFALKSANPLVAIIDALKSDASSEQVVLNNLRIKLRTDTFIDQINKCDNIINQSQTNTIKGVITPDCISSLSKAGMTSQDILKLSNSMKVDGIKQINISNSLNNCKANIISNALSKLNATIDVLAVQEAINKAKGLMATSTSSSKVCNYVDTGVSACKYVSQQQCCSNHTTTTQQNILETGCIGGFSGITQQNDMKIHSICLLSAESTVTDETITNIKNKTVQKAENTSEGLTTNFLIIILVILALIFFAPIIAAKSLSGNIFKILGVLLIICGFALIIYYFTQKKDEKYTKNNPYSYCQKTTIKESVPFRSDLNSVKQYTKDSSDVIGYDFFSDDINLKGDIKNNEIGMCIYLTNVTENDVCEKIEKDKVKTISYIKGSNPTYLWITGTTLIVASIIMILIGIFKKSSVDKTSSEISDSSEISV